MNQDKTAGGESKGPGFSFVAYLELLLSALYYIFYCVGVRLIRYERRLVRRSKRAALRLWWFLRRKYFDRKESPRRGKLSLHLRLHIRQPLQQTAQNLRAWRRGLSAATHRDSGYFWKGTILELGQALRPVGRLALHSINYLLPAAALVLLVTTIQHYGTQIYALRVEYNGEYIGYILNEKEFYDAEKEVQARVINEQYLPPEKHTPLFTLEAVEADQLTDQEILTNNIIQASGNEIQEATGLYVDGTFVAAVSDGEALLDELKAMKEEEKQIVLERLALAAQEEEEEAEEEESTDESTEDASDETTDESQEESASQEEETGTSDAGALTVEEDDDISVSFVKPIKVSQGLYPVSSVMELSQVVEKLNSVVEGQKTYTIQEGDSPWTISLEVGVPVETLLSLNPEVSKNMLVGDKFIIANEEPFLQRKVEKTIVEEVEVPYETEEEIDSNKESSYTEVVQEGENGINEVTSRVTYVDGYETDREVIQRTVIKEPVNAKVVVGSLQASTYNFSNSGVSGGTNVGGYIWPVNGGYISCPIYGYAGHTGTDIAADAGTLIFASKSGTVEYAGWSNGYGYNILINHGDGTKTRYAHCSSLATVTGSYVTQGQVIGYVGRTGWATGNHCHFEIIANGTYLDARNYIGYSR